MPDKMYTIVQGSMDSDYAREVLGHGGVNVFPSKEGTCSDCGAFIRAHLVENTTICPQCGNPVPLVGSQTYGEWSYERGRAVNDECRFIERAARGGVHRRPVIPIQLTA